MIGDVELGCGRSEADQQHSAVAVAAIAPGEVEPCPLAHGEQVVGDAAGDHPRLDALPGVVLRSAARRFAADSGGVNAITGQHAERDRDDDPARTRRSPGAVTTATSSPPCSIAPHRGAEAISPRTSAAIAS